MEPTNEPSDWPRDDVNLFIYKGIWIEEILQEV